MSTNPDEAAASAVAEMAQERAFQSIYSNQNVDPKTAARANALARTMGMPAEIAHSNIDALQSAQRVSQGQALAGTSPQAAGWLAQPGNAAAVGDDYQGLHQVAKVLAPPQNALTSPAQDYANRDRGFFGILMASTANAALRSWGNLVGAGGHIIDYVPGLHGVAMDYEEKARRIAANTSFAIKGRSDYNYHYSDIWHDPLKYLRNAPRETVMQIAESIPMLAETFAGKGVPLATDITAQIANARAKNNGRAEATDRDYVAALPAGIVSAAMFRAAKTEDLHGLANIASKPTSILGELGEAAIRDPITMGSQSAIQNIAETVGTKRGFRYGEMRDQAADSAIQGSTASLAMIGLGGIAARPFRAMRDASMAREGAVQIDNLMDAAAKAKSRTSAPDEFQSFVDAHTQGTSNEHVYIPGEAISTLFQSDTGAPRNIATDPFWSKYAPAVDEATRIGGDVVVPVSELATHLAGSSDWNALRDHVRFNPGGMSLAEASEYAKRAPEDMEAAAATLAAQMDQGAGHLAATRKAYQLFRDAGLPHGEAATAGALQAAWIRRVNEVENSKRVARGEEPISAAEEWDRHNLTAQKMRQEAYETGKPVSKARSSRKASGTRPAPDSPATAILHEALAATARSAGDAAVTASKAEQQGRTDSLSRTASWVIREKATGKDIMETFDRAKVDALNTSKYEAVPIGEHLGNLGERPQAAPAAPEVPKAGEPRIVHTFATQLEADKFFNENRLSNEKVDRGDALGRDWRYMIEPHEGGFAIVDHAGENGRDHALSQDGPTKRGNISIARGADTMPYAATIRAFESANVSTAVHEMGHYWIEDLRARALRDDATPQEQADWQAVKDWFFDLGHSVDAKEMIPEAAHENWARGVERYVMEGKAPSSALKGVFARMATWLRGIYKSVIALDAPITPEIRDVMDRLLATDEEIAIARDNLSAKPMEGAEALMTKSEREAYHKLASETQDDAYQSLLERTMQVIKARTTSDYRERRDAIREEVIQSVDAQPVHRAMKTFREGVNGEKVKIPEQWLKDSYGPDIKGRLPKSIDPIWGKEGIDPEEVAGRAGFDSADQMVKALMEMAAAKEAMKASGDKRSVRAAAIEEQLKARVDAEIGDPYRDVETEAKAAIANDKMGDLFSMETRALARVTGRAPTVWKQATEWAKGHIAGQTTQDALTGASLQRYARSVAKAGKQAEDALAHDDHDAALTFKKQQLLNAALLSESKKAKERVEVAARKLQRIARAKNIKAVDQDYLEQAHALLEQVRMDTESGVKIGKIKSFQKWYGEQLDNGREPIVPDDYKELLGTQNWREMRVGDLLELNDFVGQIIAMGRLKKTLRDGVRVRDRETAIQEMLDRAEANVVQRKQSARYDEKSGFLAGMPARFKGVIRSADAAMLKFEQLMNFMDNAEANGPWTRMMMSPINKAAADASRLMRPLLETIQQAIKDTPREVLDTWSRPVDTPELLNWAQTDQPHLLGQPWQFNKDSIISMALNWGNEGNKQRLLDGYHWQEADVKAVMDRVLSEHDWRYVDTVLKQVGSLWPAIEELERRVNGYAPDKIEATPIETPFGTLEGGYFPAVYDPDLASAADLVKMEKLSGGGFHSVSTRASATKERMDRVEKPILLDTTVVTRHLREVIHDVSHREAVFQVRSLLGEDRVKAAITNLMGPEYYQAAKGWIENVAHPGIADSLQDKRLIAFVKGLNKRITVAGLGFRISTILQQPTNFATTMAEVGNARYAKHMAMFHVDLAKGTPAMWKEVMAHSEEMRERMHNLDTNISDFYAQQAKNPLITGPGKIMNAAFKGIALTDLYITVPGWMAAYEKATVENEMTHEEAVNYADGIIRKTQGAGGPKDQAAIQRTVWMKAFNPFFSYWSSHYNMQRSIGHEARRVKNPAHITNLVNRMVLQLLVPMAVQQALFGPKKGKDSDGKEESEVHYLLKGVLLGNMMSIPGLSPVLNHFGYGYPYKPSPWARFEEAGEKTYKDVVKGYKHEEGEGDEPKSWIRDTFDTIAYTGALPVSQAGATLQGLYDYHRGEAHPDGFNDWSDLLTKGKVEKHNQ